jgi:hypothetical protein
MMLRQSGKALQPQKYVPALLPCLALRMTMGDPHFEHVGDGISLVTAALLERLVTGRLRALAVPLFCKAVMISSLTSAIE